jgi:predicted transcriptional regulator
MLAQELINSILPQLQLSDTVEHALHLMSDYKVTHVPVVEGEKYLGLLSEDNLLDEANKENVLEFFKDDFIHAAVAANAHFLNAVTLSTHYQTNVVPVVNEFNELIGSIPLQQLLAATGNFAGANETGAVIELEMETSRFSISEISRIVESDGAHILHLNMTVKPGSALLNCTINLNKREISTIIAAFERYDYTVSYYSGEELFENEIDINYRHLMNYLDI